MNYQYVLNYMKEIISDNPPPVQQFGAHCLSDTNKTPDGRLRFLVALLLSSQTKDPITAQALYKLDSFLGKQFTQQDIDNFKCGSINEIKQHNLTFSNLKLATVQQLEQLIYPVGFYKKKAIYIKQLESLTDVPSSVKELVTLNGIGYKMAHIATRTCFGKVTGIAVDTHVQRITQKLQWAGKSDLSSPPNQVMKDLEDAVPQELWGEMNETIVGFGQSWCSAVNPRCSECKLMGKECTWKPVKKVRK